jgi:Flp pilus assembly protein TadD
MNEPNQPENTEPRTSDTPSEETVGYKIRLGRLEKKLRSILSIALMVLLTVFGLALMHFLYAELSYEGYVIEQVNVPEPLVQAGFSGPLIANRISYELQEILETTRQQEYAQDYTSGSDDTNLSIELVGVGVPIRGIVDLIGDAFGFDRGNRVKADVYFAGSRVMMILKISGEKPEYIEADQDENFDVPMKSLITKAAEKILKYSDDHSLQRYYLNFRFDGEESIALAQYRLEKYQGDSRKEAAILADWAMGLLRLNKYDAAESKVREGLSKDSTVAQLHLTLGTIYLMQDRLEESLAEYNTTMKLFTVEDRKLDRLRTYNNIGNIYNRKRNADSAFFYYRKVLDIDPKFNIVYYNMGLVYLQVRKDTALFLDNIDKAFLFGLNPAYLQEDPDLKGVQDLKAFQDLRRKYLE